MPFYVYILHSEAIDQYYIGHSEDLDNRIYRHNNSGSKFTKKAKDWKLVYKKEYALRSEAMEAEPFTPHSQIREKHLFFSGEIGVT